MEEINYGLSSIAAIKSEPVEQITLLDIQNDIITDRIKQEIPETDQSVSNRGFETENCVTTFRDHSEEHLRSHVSGSSMETSSKKELCTNIDRQSYSSPGMEIGVMSLRDEVTNGQQHQLLGTVKLEPEEEPATDNGKAYVRGQYQSSPELDLKQEDNGQINTITQPLAFPVELIQGESELGLWNLHGTARPKDTPGMPSSESSNRGISKRRTGGPSKSNATRTSEAQPPSTGDIRKRKTSESNNRGARSKRSKGRPKARGKKTTPTKSNKRSPSEKKNRKSTSNKKPRATKKSASNENESKSLPGNKDINNPKEKSSHICKICGATSPTKYGLKKHEVTHSVERPYKCTECDRDFKRPGELLTHGRTHTGEKPFVCTECGMSFIQSSGLTIHQRSHTGEKPYVCSYCGHRFSSSGSLTQHKRVHTGEKPYKCAVCDRAFTLAGHRTKHMLTHTGEKPYMCQCCGKGYTQGSNLIIHMRTHTGEKPYICTVCDKGFVSLSALKRHQRMHSGEKPYVCNICGKAFAQYGAHQYHMGVHVREKAKREKQATDG